MNAGTVHLEALCLLVIFIKLEGFCAKCTVLAGNRTRPVFGVKRGGSSKAGLVLINLIQTSNKAEELNLAEIKKTNFYSFLINCETNLINLIRS